MYLRQHASIVFEFKYPSSVPQKTVHTYALCKFDENTTSWTVYLDHIYFVVLLQSQCLVNVFVYVKGCYTWALLVEGTHDGVLAIAQSGVLLPSLLPHYTQ